MFLAVNMYLIVSQIINNKAMKKVIIVMVTSFIILSCGSSNLKSTNEVSKTLDEMMNKKTFQIISSWAQPQVTLAMQQLGNAGMLPQGSTVANIDISSHTNYLKMVNDSVKAVFPYYGERQFGGGYNNNEGIEFEGNPQNLTIEKDKKDSYDIQFEIKDKNSSSENYQVFIKLFTNLASTIKINSNQRSSIQYRGTVSAINIENKN